MSFKRFQIALSFPGEQREYVSKVADYLAAKLGKEKVFYDAWYQAELARPNLGIRYLPNLYLNEAQLIVPFLCADYERKEWCGLEWRVVMELIKQRRDEDIMLLRFDNTDIPGLLSIDGYLDIKQLSAQQTAEEILKRLPKSESMIITQAQAELDYLEKLEQQLQIAYTPLVAESCQKPHYNSDLLHKRVGASVLELLAKNTAQKLPEQKQHYQDIQTAFRDVSRAVLLGEPGAGKTTSLHKLAYDSIKNYRLNASAPVPVFIKLGEWRDNPQSFAQYLDQQLGSLARFINALLQQQRLILLLDGLNETPSNLRVQKANDINQWLQQPQQRKLPCYVSCRNLDYSNDIKLDLNTITIQPLDPPRIQGFIQAMLGEEQQAIAEQLFWLLGGGDILREVWDKWQQAGASEQQFWCSAEVPRENPDVWHKTNDHLDEIWRKAVHDPHSLLKLAANPFMLSMLVVVYDNNQQALPQNRTDLITEFVNILIHREQLEARQDSIISGLQKLAWAMQQSEQNVQTSMSRQQALQQVDDRLLQQAARLNLLDSGDDIRFSHQLFQEYFTALMLHDKLEHSELEVRNLWRSEQFWQPSGWEETILLLTGLYPDDCSKVLRWLLSFHPELMMRCIEQLGLTFDPAIYTELNNYWQQSWLSIEHYPEPEARASIARAFGMAGLDNRSGIGVNDKGLPDIEWVAIPKGKVTLENNAGKYSVEAFYLAKYPVTNMQFQCFIDDTDGYRNPHWWSGLEQQIAQAYHPFWSEANHPKVYVCWYEAMAFCAWASDRLGYEITLPTEWQWQQAACSGQADFNFPWGKDYISGYANINETWEHDKVGNHNLQRTTAVGLYPQGNSLQGVADLSGNVWEWCLNGYDNPKDTQLSGAFSRVARGGGWYHNQGYARASYRDGYSPDDRDGSIGFRVCVVACPPS